VVLVKAGASYADQAEHLEYPDFGIPLDTALDNIFSSHEGRAVPISGTLARCGRLAIPLYLISTAAQWYGRPVLERSAVFQWLKSLRVIGAWLDVFGRNQVLMWSGVVGFVALIILNAFSGGMTSAPEWSTYAIGIALVPGLLQIVWITGVVLMFLVAIAIVSALVFLSSKLFSKIADSAFHEDVKNRGG
jgi:hypothetical protein